jgi:uncharacterized membrane protein YjgN (DUF898 family)
MVGAGAGGMVAGQPPVLQLAYRGNGADFFILLLKNAFLTLVTLGIYAAWARTERRKYVWRQLDIGGQPLDYTGTGKELFFGYLKVIGGYIVLIGIPQLVLRLSPGAGVALQLVGVVAILVVIPYAIYWSRRYLLGRTRWRGIRFGLTGEAGKFAKMFLLGVLLTAITLGFYGPIFANRIYGEIMRNTRYGTGAFSYDGPDNEAFKIWIKGFFLSLLTFGIYSFWYQAALMRFRLSHTHFDRATGQTDVTGGLLFKLTIINVLAIGFTAGIAFPWVVTYTLRELVSRMTLVGPIDFSQVMQQAPSGNAAGDTLASALGVELGV